MSGFTPIDLGKLPAPEVIKTVAYDALLAEMKAEVLRRMPELEAALAYESEPVTQLLRVCAWYRMLDRIEFNDGARACMLALASGTNLDHLAALWGVARLIIQQADDTVRPPIAEVRESDADFRARIALAPEACTTAGPRGAYIYWARTASGAVRDVGVVSPTPGEVAVSVLSQDGNGAADKGLIDRVRDALNAEDVRPLTDHVSVRSAAIVEYEIQAELILYDGPDAAVVRQAAEDALKVCTQACHRIGHDVTLSAIYAALHRPGVQNVRLTRPDADIVVGPAEAAYCTGATVTVGGRDV